MLIIRIVRRARFSGALRSIPTPSQAANGILSQDLTIRNNLDFEGIKYYCCNNQNIAEAPAPQADPGARTLLSLGNGINAKGDGTQSTKPSSDPRPGILTSAYTNLHFHRLNVPPTCHQEASAPLGTTAIGWTMRIPA
ncbi:MAG: hypothetical protein H0X25_06645 [Acidobacteriales bacterium]|nr:hypothetical protein [Terriglobales bacterium]